MGSRDMAHRPDPVLDAQDGTSGRVGDPGATVLAQDACVGAGGLDIPRWTATVFFPLTMISTNGTMVIDHAEGFAEHLTRLSEFMQRRGAVSLRTHITGQSQPADNMAIVTSLREHLNTASHVVTTSSITWSLILTPSGWRINQIHFNDARNDPSVVSEMLRDKGDTE